MATVFEIILMEQPEIHLHPSAQSALADVMIDVINSRENGADRNIQVIIETHSEHFLRRLQRRIAEDAVPQQKISAYLALAPNNIPQALTSCVLACVEAVEHVVKKGGVVIDAGHEIFDEYRQQLSMKGQPGVGDRFMKWVHDNRWKFPDTDRVLITKNGESYDQFPDHDGLNT